MLNNKGSAAAAAAAAAAAVNPEQQLHQQLTHATGHPHVHGGSTSHSGSERAGSPHHTEYGTNRYGSRGSGQSLQAVPGMQDGLHYPSPSQLHAPLPMLQTGVTMQNTGFESSYGHTGVARPPLESPTQKAFPCGTCGKGFARRSDLARHERIHTGVRPHVCEHPGCNKQFIQRSALTVHARVHTGEKPHMCERCGKVRTCPSINCF